MSDSDMTSWAEVGDRLREGREYLGLSQDAVSKQTGIPRSAISDIERGQRKVDSLELRRLARLYRRPVGHFVGEESADPGDGTVQALARAVTDLTEQDRSEVLRFAEFLRHSAALEQRKRPG
jgi:transcriptional regulator with XRE-family HTH domain